MIKFQDIYFLPILKSRAITILGPGVAQQVRRKSRPFLHTFKKDIDPWNIEFIITIKIKSKYTW